MAGAIGGLVASWTMNRFQSAWSAVAGDKPESSGGSEYARDWQERAEDTNANELAAQAIASRTIHRGLTRDGLAYAAPAVLYGFGAAMGALYGGLTEFQPAVRAGTGSAYGTAIWIAADEIGVPMAGLEHWAADYPFELHAQSFGAQVVYGLTLEAVSRGVRALL